MNFRVAFLGFSEFERSALASYFRLAQDRSLRYEQVQSVTDADFLVADADHAPSVQLVLATERTAQTVFIGSRAPAEATAWMMRPIDALHVMRELDAMVTLGGLAPKSEPAMSNDDVGVLLQPSTPSVRPMLPAAPHRHRPLPPGAAGAVGSAGLPLHAGAVAPPPAVLPREQAPALLRRVLLVDDSEIALRFLETRLQRWELQIDRAAGSTRAQELLASNAYDFVFLDVELGPASPLDGLELCQRIKQSPSAVGTAVILVSAHRSELDRVRGALAGCDAYLGKPLDELELNRLLLRQGLKAPKDADAAHA